MYHIDQLGQVVQEVPETRACEGCMYNIPRKCLRNEAPIKWTCATNSTIYKLVVPEPTTKC